MKNMKNTFKTVMLALVLAVSMSFIGCNRGRVITEAELDTMDLFSSRYQYDLPGLTENDWEKIYQWRYEDSLAAVNGEVDLSEIYTYEYKGETRTYYDEVGKVQCKIVKHQGEPWCIYLGKFDRLDSIPMVEFSCRRILQKSMQTKCNTVGERLEMRDRYFRELKYILDTVYLGCRYTMIESEYMDVTF